MKPSSPMDSLPVWGTPTQKGSFSFIVAILFPGLALTTMELSPSSLHLHDPVPRVGSRLSRSPLSIKGSLTPSGAFFNGGSLRMQDTTPPLGSLTPSETLLYLDSLRWHGASVLNDSLLYGDAVAVLGSLFSPETVPHLGYGRRLAARSACRFAFPFR